MFVFSILSGTLLNVLTVLVGGTLGVILGSKVPARLQATVFDGLGLLTIVIGIQMASRTENVLLMMAAVLLGGVVGEGLRIERGIERFGDWAQRRIGRRDSRFSEAFVGSSLLFCVGPLTITGAIENGLTGSYRLLGLKSGLDLFGAFAFGASLGAGVLASAVTVLVVQGGLALGAGAVSSALDAGVITELTAVGGLLITGIGINLLGLKHVAVANFLPALLLTPLLVWLIRWLGPLAAGML